MRIPKYLVQGIKLAQGSEIEIKYYNQSLVIKPKNKKSTRSKSLLKELRLKTGIKLYLTGRILAKKNNMVKKTPDQGDVMWLSLNPAKGHEQSGRRPVIVITKRNTTGRPDVFLCVRLQQKEKGI